MLGRGFDRGIVLEFQSQTRFDAGGNLQRLPNISYHVKRNRTCENRDLGLRERLQTLVQFWIIGPPNQVTGLDPTKIDIVVAKLKLHQRGFISRRGITNRFDLVNVATFFGFIRAAPIGGIKHDPVTTPNFMLTFNDDRFLFDLDDRRDF